MIKEGDTFKNIKSGEVFRVRSIKSDTIILTTKGDFHSIITSRMDMDSTFMPFIETDAAPKSK